MDVGICEADRLLNSAAAGNRDSWGELLASHAPRLARLIAVRLDRRLQGRIDADDVLQEIWLEAWRGWPGFAKQPLPFYLWLRGIAGNKLLELHRFHLGTQKRDARRERSDPRGAMPDSTSGQLIALILDSATSASAAARRDELKTQLHAALDGMPSVDREVLMLRHFEQLSPAETAAVLGVNDKAAGMRYLRAVKRLGQAIAQLPGGLEAFRP